MSLNISESKECVGVLGVDILVYTPGYDDGHRYRFDRDRHNYKSHMYAELLKEKQQKAKRKGKTLKESTVNRLNKKIKKHARLFKENAKIANMYK